MEQSEIDQHKLTFRMADNVMMNEGALQQQGFREEDYQEEILRLRGQLVASQQAERLAMEQLAVQRPSVTVRAQFNKRLKETLRARISSVIF